MKLINDNSVFVDGHLRSWEEINRNDDYPIRDFVKFGPVALIVDNSSVYKLLPKIINHEIDCLLIDKNILSNSYFNLLVDNGFNVFDCLEKKWIVKSKRVKSVIGRLSLLTSGTTGRPKIVSHTWNTLFTTGKASLDKKHNWLVPFQIGTYAWFQLITLGLFKNLQNLYPMNISDLDYERVCDFIISHQVDSISSTPTFWNFLLIYANKERMKELPLKLISLGGEIVTQVLLDELGAIFPLAQITHIYASTEAGAAIIVKDRLAGFPVKILNSINNPQVKITDNELWVKSDFSSINHSNQWVNTGDIAEIKGDRVYFRGRKENSYLNINGQKIFAHKIEEEILKHPDILWCKVQARKMLLGSIIIADFVNKNNGSNLNEIDLTKFVSKTLEPQYIPRLWNKLTLIPQNHKTLKALI